MSQKNDRDESWSIVSYISTLLLIFRYVDTRSDSEIIQKWSFSSKTIKSKMIIFIKNDHFRVRTKLTWPKLN